jgi:L-iditol 2-dehydrogenase
MKAAVLHEFGKMVIEDVPTPTPGPNEVVVRIKACGLCATDHKAYTGKRDNVAFPKILGHEPAGVIAKVGVGVTEFREGDEAIVQPAGFCGFCEFCRSGKQHCCVKRFTIGGDGGADIRSGCFAEYALQNASSVYHKPKGLSWESASLTEPLAGSWKGLIHYSQMQVGEDVVVIGTGGIGMLVLMLAVTAGAGTAIAVDVSDYALANAMKFGATHAINPRKQDVKKAVYDILPAGPDLVVEAAGPVEAVQMMFDLCRRGTRVNLFGITTHEKVHFDGGYTHFLETRMDASFSITPQAMVNAIRLMERGLLDPARIITHRFGLDRINEAMAIMDTPEHNKVMIFPDESERRA